MVDASSAGSITLIPSVHVSAKRIDAVSEELRALEPDIIAVELDEARFESLTTPSESLNRFTDLFNTMSTPTATVYLALGVVQISLVFQMVQI